MNLVKGKNIVCSLNLGGTYYPFFCAKTAELVLEQDEIEVTSVNSGADREYEPGMSNQVLSCSGIHILDNTESKISANYLRTNIRRVVQSVRITQTDDDGTVYIDNFSAIIRRVSISRETSGYAQSAVDLRITGVVSSTVIVPPNPEGVGAIYLPASSGNTVTNATLVGKEALLVEREGLGYDVVSGTPSGRQCAFDSSTGTVTFDASLPFSGLGETVYVLYQS